MTNKIWKMCVVGLMLASPAVCSAATNDEITAAVAAIDDGMCVMMEGAGSITLQFDQSVTLGSSGGLITVHLCGPSNYILLTSGSQSQEFWEEGGYGDGDTVSLWVPAGYLSPLTISAAGGFTENFVAYVDAVQILDVLGDPIEQQPAVVCSDHDEPVTALTDNPIGMIENLVGLVTSYNLQQGIDNSLDAKLASASDALEDVNANNDAAAVNKLEAFISEVEVQRGKKLEAWQADELHGEADAIIAVLTAP
jgi:hypothetical protein